MLNIIRRWLIKKLAGDWIVIINYKLGPIHLDNQGRGVLIDTGRNEP